MYMFSAVPQVNLPQALVTAPPRHYFQCDGGSILPHLVFTDQASLTSIAYPPPPPKFPTLQFQGFNFFLHSTFSFMIRLFCFLLSFVFSNKSHVSSLHIFFFCSPLRPPGTSLLRLLFSGICVFRYCVYFSSVTSTPAREKVKVRMRCQPELLAAISWAFSELKLHKACFSLT